jgi:enoyl-CoA hydratase/carnithine racemase
MYNGDRARWRRFAWGLRALNLNHYTAKTTYNPAAVIAAVDSSFGSNADDALLQYTATSNDDMNFWGRTRNNLTNFRQTQFVVGLMNGTAFGGGTVDPRMSRMLAVAPDGVYRGLDINTVGFGALTTAQQPNNFFGYPGTGGLQSPSRYLFDDRTRMPIMTYAQLQFVKAEAALRAGDRTTALTAYRNGINAHFDFVNARNTDANQAATQIPAAERTAYLAAPAINPATPAALTLTQIMVQKYIAQWAWGHNELWMDMRRFGYTGLDPQTGAQVYPGFAPPTNLFPDNGGLVVQRIRARFNSEYVWNRAALDRFGGLAVNFHTVPLWITQP